MRQTITIYVCMYVTVRDTNTKSGSIRSRVQTVEERKEEAAESATTTGGRLRGARLRAHEGEGVFPSAEIIDSVVTTDVFFFLTCKCRVS